MFRAVLLLSAVSCAAAQPLAFEVASIKPNHSGSGSSSYNTHPASLEGINNSLSSWIQFAYNLKPGQISAPPWLESERFDIVAKAAHEAKEDELRQMLQALLADRFKLMVHREEKQLSGYALVVDKGGLKIHPVDGNRNHMHGTRNSLEAIEAPMKQLAGNLEYFVGRPVTNETSISGVFTYTLTWKPDDVTGPTMFEALREQLGLKLEERKTPMEVVVVDHVERVPTEN